MEKDDRGRALAARPVRYIQETSKQPWQSANPLKAVPGGATVRGRSAAGCTASPTAPPSGRPDNRNDGGTAR